jgi:hypothetical protein
MKVRLILLIAGALLCGAVGFLIAQRWGAVRYEDRATTAVEEHATDLSTSRALADQWADALAMSQGRSILQAFVAGITPAVLAQRRETMELATVSLLRIPGVAGIHVFGAGGEVLYSSDAKLTTTGEAEYRGTWALEASDFASRQSTRPGMVDFAAPISDGTSKLAVVWLEYDLARVRDAARPVELIPDVKPSAPPPPAETDAASGEPQDTPMAPSTPGQSVQEPPTH